MIRASAPYTSGEGVVLRPFLGGVPLYTGPPITSKLTFAYKTETLGSLYSHGLLILTESPKSKLQVVHEQKVKDLQPTHIKLV